MIQTQLQKQPIVLSKAILDAKYEKADLAEVARSATHLSEMEQEELHRFLTKYEDLFDGSLGKWNMGAYDIELRPDVTPYHARAFPIPQVHTGTLKIKVERLCKVGVLKKVNHCLSKRQRSLRTIWTSERRRPIC